MFLRTLVWSVRQAAWVAADELSYTPASVMMMPVDNVAVSVDSCRRIDPMLLSSSEVVQSGLADRAAQ